MKKSLLVLLLSYLVLNSFSQDTIYLHSIDDTIASPKEKALYYKTINGIEDSFEISTYYSNGNIISKIHYSSLKPEIKNGDYETYFYDGSVNIKGTFINNKMEGVWLMHNNEKGFIEEKTNFKNNLKNGRSFLFYENGKLKRLDIYIRDTLGLSTCYDTVGNIINCDSIYKSNVHDIADIMPSFPNGGVQALMKFLSKNIMYSKNALEAGLQGKVLVKFIIDIDGSILNPQVIKNNTRSNELAQEAIRVILSMPKWIPGTQNGKPVKVHYTLPITFSTD